MKLKQIFYTSILSILLAFSCSKQNTEEGGTVGAGGTIFLSDAGLDNVTDPNLVGNVKPISPSQTQDLLNNACNAEGIEPEPYPAKIVLLVDVSSSMSSTAPGTNSSKWEVTRDALVEAVCGVTGTGLSDTTAVGLMFYPNMVNQNVATTPTTPNTCMNTGGITPMNYLGNNDPGTQRTVLRTALTQAVLGRGTPTFDAYRYVVDNIVNSTAQAAFPGDSYILLITDGMPTLYEGCYNPQGTLSNLPGDGMIPLVDNAFNKGIKTFIIGSPGSEGGKAWLSLAAFTGGTGAANCNPNNANGPYCHMDMTTATDFSIALRDGLQQVVQTVGGCKFTIPAKSIDGTKDVDINLIHPVITYVGGNSELVGRDNKNGSSCTEGFYLISNSQLSLCKDTCDRYLGDTKASLQIIYGCDEIINNTIF